MSTTTFVVPPGWPAVPAGWCPPASWEPSPEWPAAPQGWVFYRGPYGEPAAPPANAWVPKLPGVAGVAVLAPQSPPAAPRSAPKRSGANRVWLIGGAAVVVIVVVVAAVLLLGRSGEKPLTGAEFEQVVAMDSWPTGMATDQMTADEILSPGGDFDSVASCQSGSATVKDGLVQALHHTGQDFNEDSVYAMWSTTDQAKAAGQAVIKCLNDEGKMFALEPVSDSHGLAVSVKMWNRLGEGDKGDPNYTGSCVWQANIMRCATRTVNGKPALAPGELSAMTASEIASVR